MSYSFSNPDGTFLNETAGTAIQVAVPTTGATITLASGTTDLLVNPAGTIATLTVKLPPNPMPGQSIEISFFQVVTALTVQDYAGGAITGAPTAGAIGVSTELRYVTLAAGSRWVKWR